MQGEAWAGGGGGQRGLMGIRQEGKQASKPQQKPPTWPRVKHNSLVTCQAASGVITPNAVDYIILNSARGGVLAGRTFRDNVLFKCIENTPPKNVNI